MKNKIYLGYGEGLRREIFRSETEPMRESHEGQWLAVTGPFRTVRGARFMREYGRGNPHCRCVAEAEYLGKKYAVKA